MHPLIKLFCAGTAVTALQWWSLARAASSDSGNGGGNTAGWNSVDEFFQDHSAWIAFRKKLEPSPIVGVSYPITVKLEVKNLGKRDANDLTVSDAWNLDDFRIDIPEPSSERLDFTLNTLSSGESHTFEYQIIPLRIGQLSVSRANMTYEESPSSTISGLSSSVSTIECVSASKFSRMNGWIFPYIVLFVLLVVISIAIPIHSLIFKCGADESTFRKLFPFVFNHIIDRLPDEYRSMILKSLAIAVQKSRQLNKNNNNKMNQNGQQSNGSMDFTSNNNRFNNQYSSSSSTGNRSSKNGSGKSSSVSSSASSSGPSSSSSSSSSSTRSRGKHSKGNSTKRR